MLIDSDILRI